MHVIRARNVNDAYRNGLSLMQTYGLPTPSRNGPVLRVSDPVTTVYEFPQERVLFDSTRDANPFFHLFESLWMLNGDNDVHYLDRFLPSFKQFSDDGETFHGAYGYRWRHWRGLYQTETLDQLTEVIAKLRENPTDRRAVIGMWDPWRDLRTNSKDIPCNDLVKCAIVNGKLDLHVYCRSNDIIWGAYGANAVQFAFLQEYLATMIGVPMGRLFQISGDYHAYVERPYVFQKFIDLPVPYEPWTNPYDEREPDRVLSTRLITDPNTFDAELRHVVSAIRTGDLIDHDPEQHRNLFFQFVVYPMFAAHTMYKTQGAGPAYTLLKASQEPNAFPIDWIRAGLQWLLRRTTPKDRSLPPIPDAAKMPVFHSNR